MSFTESNMMARRIPSPLVRDTVVMHLVRLGQAVPMLFVVLTGFFCEGPVTDWTSAARADKKRYAAFFHGMLERGIYLAPSQFEAAFVSLAHTEADLDHAARAATESIAAALHAK